METVTFRILDAAANRVREGLRVIEDYARFGLQDAFLTAECKNLRHELAELLSAIDPRRLLASRETLTDVGTSLTTMSEAVRLDQHTVVAANCKRIQEALRSLEEYGKTISPAIAASLEQLRYRSYTLEKAISNVGHAVASLDQCHLYVLIPGGESIAKFTELVTALLDANVDAIQLRDKRLADRELLERGEVLRKLIDQRLPAADSALSTSKRVPLMIFNDRPDLAVLARADGVHVGQEELTVSAVRRIVGPQMLVGVSTHTIAQARQAVLDGADYIGVGPTFPSRTKPFESFAGLDFCREVAAELALPAFAIGGINADNLAELLATGIKRVAVGECLNDPATVGENAQQLRGLLTRGTISG
ncbi:MAG: thiamine phosphate synthase [Pirellulales bacterium]|nr:thiamine phosphate synthase [Pirellulales bacterium]